MRDSVSSGLAMMLALNVPATVGLIVLAHPIVALLFERGQFTPADTTATAGALVAYAIGLTGYSVVKIASPTFYALGQSRTPVLVSVLSVLTNAGLNLLLVREYGYRGLAVGTSVTALLNGGLLLVLLRQRLGGLGLGHLTGVLVRVLAASLMMGAVAWGVDRQLSIALPGTALPVQIARLLATICAALAVLAASLHLLRVREFTDVVAAVVNRLARARR
jgi:putative peptidoglycan lipid II flippase